MEKTTIYYTKLLIDLSDVDTEDVDATSFEIEVRKGTSAISINSTFFKSIIVPAKRKTDFLKMPARNVVIDDAEIGIYYYFKSRVITDKKTSEWSNLYSERAGDMENLLSFDVNNVFITNTENYIEVRQKVTNVPTDIEKYEIAIITEAMTSIDDYEPSGALVYPTTNIKPNIVIYQENVENDVIIFRVEDVEKLKWKRLFIRAVDFSGNIASNNGTNDWHYLGAGRQSFYRVPKITDGSFEDVYYDDVSSKYLLTNWKSTTDNAETIDKLLVAQGPDDYVVVNDGERALSTLGLIEYYSVEKINVNPNRVYSFNMYLAIDLNTVNPLTNDFTFKVKQYNNGVYLTGKDLIYNVLDLGATYTNGTWYLNTFELPYLESNCTHIEPIFTSTDNGVYVDSVELFENESSSKQFFLKSDANVVGYSHSDGVFAPAEVNVEARMININGNVIWTVTAVKKDTTSIPLKIYDKANPTTQVTQGQVTAVKEIIIKVDADNEVTKNHNELVIKCDTESVDGIGNVYTDAEKLLILRDGNGLILDLDNDNATLPASSSGTVTSFVNATSIATLYRGLVEVIASEVVYTVAYDATLITCKDGNGVAVASGGVAKSISVTAWLKGAVNEAVVTFTATYTDPATSVVSTRTAEFTLTKSIAGVDSKSFQLLQDAYVASEVVSDGSITPAVVKFDIQMSGLGTNVKWSTQTTGGLNFGDIVLYAINTAGVLSSPITLNSSITVKTAYMYTSEFVGAPSLEWILISAKSVTDTAYTDYCTVDYLHGLHNKDIVLDNISHGLPTDETGNTVDFTNATSNAKFYVGGVDKTADATWNAKTPVTGITLAVTANNIATVTGMTIDSGWVTFSATYEGTTYTKNFDIYKAKQGATGATGNPAPTDVYNWIIYGESTDGGTNIINLVTAPSANTEYMGVSKLKYSTKTPTLTASLYDWTQITDVMFVRDATITNTLTIGDASGAGLFKSSDWNVINETGFELRGYTTTQKARFKIHGELYAGKGGKYLQFDGTNISWAGVNSSLTTGGLLTATNVDLTGIISSVSGDVGGWILANGNIYKLTSGTPSVNPSGGVVLKSSTTTGGLYVYDGTTLATRVGVIPTTENSGWGASATKDASASYLDLCDVITGWTATDGIVDGGTYIVLGNGGSTYKTNIINTPTYAVDTNSVSVDAFTPVEIGLNVRHNAVAGTDISIRVSANGTALGTFTLLSTDTTFVNKLFYFTPLVGSIQISLVATTHGDASTASGKMDIYSIWVKRYTPASYLSQKGLFISHTDKNFVKIGGGYTELIGVQKIETSELTINGDSLIHGDIIFDSELKLESKKAPDNAIGRELSLFSGKGGTSITTAAPVRGGSLYIGAGDGGNIYNQTNTQKSGNGGNLYLSAGNPGILESADATATVGNGGNIIFTPGNGTVDGKTQIQFADIIYDTLGGSTAQVITITGITYTHTLTFRGGFLVAYNRV